MDVLDIALLGPTNAERTAIESVLSQERFARPPRTFKEKTTLYDACIQELGRLRGAQPDTSDTLAHVVRDYLVSSHVNLDDDDLVYHYMTREFNEALPIDRLAILETYLRIASVYDWNPLHRAGMYLAVAELAVSVRCFDVAQDALRPLRAYETNPPAHMTFTITQRAQALTLEAQLAALQAGKRRILREAAAMRYTEALQFFCDHLDEDLMGMGPLMLSLLEDERNYMGSPELAQAVDISFSMLRNSLEPHMERIREQGCMLENRDFVDFYVNVLAGHARTLGVHRQHERSYSLLEKAIAIQDACANAQGEFEQEGDALLLTRLRRMQAFSFDVVKHDMRATVRHVMHES